MVVSETTASTQLPIGGEERPAADPSAVYDPHDGSVAGHAAAASREQALDAVEAAQKAWPAWAALSATERTRQALAALEDLDADAECSCRPLRFGWERRRSSTMARRSWGGGFRFSGPRDGVAAIWQRYRGPKLHENPRVTSVVRASDIPYWS
jgi:hypothetical protein